MASPFGIVEGAKKAYSFFFNQVEVTKEEVIQTDKEIKKEPTYEVLVNRYPTYVSETVDQGTYGYPTRDEVLKSRGMSEVERCFKDPKVRSSMKVLVAPIFAKDFVIESADDTEEAQEQKAFHDNLISEVKGSPKKFLRELVMWGAFVGLGVSEIVPKWQTEGRFQGKLTLNFVKNKRPGLLQLVTDDYDNIIAVESLVNTGKQCDKKISPERFLIYTYEPMFGNSYGTPLFSSVWKYWWAKTEVYKHMLIYSEKFSQPIPSVKVPNNADPATKAAARNLINNLRNGGELMVPEGVELAFLEAVGKAATDPYVPLLAWLDEQIEIAILGTALSNNTQKVGTNASDTVKNDRKEDNVDEIREDLEDLYNESIIRFFSSFNYDKTQYPVSSYPKAKFIDIPKEESKTEFINNFATACEIGVASVERVSDLQHARKVLGYPDLSDEEIKQLMNEVELIRQSAKEESEIEEDEAEDIDQDKSKFSLNKKVKIFDYSGV